MIKKTIYSFIAVSLLSAFLLPGKFILNLKNSFERFLAGADSQTIQSNGEKISYYETGIQNKRSILLIHGFGGSKDNFNILAKELKKEFRVYVLDLPGFGESPSTRDAYSINDYTKIVMKFINLKNLTHLSLVGHSTGGLIAASIASKLKKRIENLWLISPLGAPGIFSSYMTKELSKGNKILLPYSTSDVSFLVSKLFNKPPFIPKRVFKYIARENYKKKTFLEKTFNKTHEIKNGQIGITNTLDKYLIKFTGQVNISWGMNDQILNFKAGKLLKELLPKVELDLYEHMGHMPMLEGVKLPSWAL